MVCGDALYVNHVPLALLAIQKNVFPALRTGMHKKLMYVFYFSKKCAKCGFRAFSRLTEFSCALRRIFFWGEAVRPLPAHVFPCLSIYLIRMPLEGHPHENCWSPLGAAVVEMAFGSP